MIKRFLEWLLSFLITEKENKISQEIEKVDEKIKGVKDEEISTDDVIDYLNK